MPEVLPPLQARISFRLPLLISCLFGHKAAILPSITWGSSLPGFHS